METWVLLVLGYGILNGFYHIVQKKAVEHNSAIEVLVMFTTFSLILVLPNIGKDILIESKYLLMIFFKSTIIFIAWMLAFKAIKKLNVSTYGILDMSKILFSTSLGIIFLSESLVLNQTIGMIIIILGLLLSNIKKTAGKIKSETKAIIFVLISCILNSSSALIDKVIMNNITSVQLQFWFILFLAVWYWVYIIFSKEKIDIKKTLKNPWIYILSIILVLGDRMLFNANAITESTVSGMSLIKQISVVVTIVIGGLMFKEKNILYKLICAAIIFLGIILVV
jgi:bacterial/archaeal transporter family protein